jgi:hypothetical protein
MRKTYTEPRRRVNAEKKKQTNAGEEGPKGEKWIRGNWLYDL